MKGDKEKPLREWQLLLILASIQFTHVLDFVLMMPLGPTFLRTFSIGPSQFGLMISAYTFSASAFGFAGAFFIDRFDRKTALLCLYSGFIFGTILCAVSTNHLFFIFARCVAGSFAGIMMGIIFAVIGDVIPEQRRGKAMGIVMSSFSVATVVGVPFGLFLASRYSWRTPFLFLAAVSTVVLILGHRWLPPFRGHLVAAVQNGKKRMQGSSYARVSSAIRELAETVFTENHLRALGLTILLFFAAFSLIPYISTSMVLNVGVAEKDLFYLYLIGGAFTFFGSQLAGRLSDRFGKFKIFAIAGLISILPIYLISHLGRAPLWMAVFITTLFMVFNSGRFVPALAMITSSVSPSKRGSFMSINSSVQQLASGIATFLAGLMIVQDKTGSLQNFDKVGLISIAATLAAIGLGSRLKKVA